MLWTGKGGFNFWMGSFCLVGMPEILENKNICPAGLCLGLISCLRKTRQMSLRYVHTSNLLCSTVLSFLFGRLDLKLQEDSYSACLLAIKANAKPQNPLLNYGAFSPFGERLESCFWCCLDGSAFQLLQPRQGEILSSCFPFTPWSEQFDHDTAVSTCRKSSGC